MGTRLREERRAKVSAKLRRRKRERRDAPRADPSLPYGVRSVRSPHSSQISVCISRASEETTKPEEEKRTCVICPPFNAFPIITLFLQARLANIFLALLGLTTSVELEREEMRSSNSSKSAPASPLVSARSWRGREKGRETHPQRQKPYLYSLVERGVSLVHRRQLLRLLGLRSRLDGGGGGCRGR
jgi:hypothetical protein